VFRELEHLAANAKLGKCPRNRQPMLLFALLWFICLSIAETAQNIDQQWAWCACSEPDLSIGGYTAVIQSGQQSQTNLAIAFYNRGIRYARTRQYDRAIQDYTQSIRLDPGRADTFANRAFAHAGTGKYDRAIQDYDAAITLDPTQRGTI
jgi:tetratricopeptide (TPR) repeat protein